MAYIGNQLTSNAFIADVFSGTGSQTVFTGMTFAPASPAAIAVFVAGSYQSPTSYSVSGTTLTFNIAPAAGTSNIQVLHLGTGATTIVPSDGSVNSVKLADGAVTGPKLGLTAINANNIVDGTITGNKIGLTSINANNIVDGTITGAKLAAATITGDKLGLTSINANNIVDGTITGTKIAAGTITGDDLAGNIIRANNIVAATITGNLIATGQITGNLLATNIINANNIVDASITAAKLAPGAAISNGQLSVVSSAIGVIPDSAAGRLPYKILGQVQAASNLATTIYTVPAATNTMITTVIICNQSQNTVTVNVSANLSGSAISTRNFIVTGYSLGAAETLVLEPRVSLNVGSILSANIVSPPNSNISLNAYGVEII